MPEVLLIKTELVYLHFSVCHVVSRLVAPSFSLANSLISADVCLQRAKVTKNTFSKVNINISYSDWVCTAVMSNDVMKDLRG